MLFVIPLPGSHDDVRPVPMRRKLPGDKSNIMRRNHDITVVVATT